MIRSMSFAEQKDTVIVGCRGIDVRWTGHYSATHIPTGAKVNWVASWNDCGWPQMRAMAKLEDMLLLPMVFAQIGGPGNVVMQVINIILWAVIACFVVYICFALFSCLLGGGGGFSMLPPHR